jgi:hypothetical protein
MSDSSKHCGNVGKDRAIGALWERRFCFLAASHGKLFTPLQLGRDTSAQAFSYSDKWISLTLPDITIWTSPGEHHEIKHKAPTKYGSIGLEEYRLQALERFSEVTGQQVFYTIHRHDLSGGRDSDVNKIEHWFSASVSTLRKSIDDGQVISRIGPTYCGGQKRELPIFYWPVSLWRPLQFN